MNLDWKTEEGRWAFITQEISMKSNLRLARYREWYIDVKFLAGQQYFYHKNGETVTIDKPARHRVRSISNQLLPLVRNFISNLARIEPIWNVMPASSNQEDVEIAILNTDVVQSIWQSKRIFEIYLQVLHWVATTGNGFIKDTWDPEMGDIIPVQEDDVTDLFTILGITEGQSLPDIKIGDFGIDVKSPFEPIFEEGVIEIEDSLWCVDANIRTPYSIKDKYGKRADGVHAEEAVRAINVFWLDKIQQSSSSLSFTTPKRDRAIVYDVYVKPHRQLKKGIHFVMVQGKDMVKPSDFPYDHGELPYTHYKEVSIPGQLYGTSTHHQNIMNQRLLNKFDSQIIEYIQQMLKGRFLVPRGSRIGEQGISDAPGSIIQYRWPMKPEMMRMLSMPRSIFEQRKNIMESIADVSSTHDPSKGKQAGSVRSAALAAEHKAADLAVLGPTQLQHDMALMRLGKHLLSNANQFIQEPRLISIAKHGQLTGSQSFTGDMLKGDKEEADYFNVVINHSGRAPWNKIVQQALVERVVQMGFLRPKEHDDVVLRAIGMEDANTVFELDELARRRQTIENRKLDKGEPVLAAKHNKHSIHMDTMVRHLESDTWDQLSEDAKKAYAEHWDQHMKLDAANTVLPELLKAKLVQQLSGAIGVQTNANPT